MIKSPMEDMHVATANAYYVYNVLSNFYITSKHTH